MTSGGENSDKTTLPSTPQLCTGLAWSSDETGGWKWGEKGAATYFTTEVGTGHGEDQNNLMVNGSLIVCSNIFVLQSCVCCNVVGRVAVFAHCFLIFISDVYFLISDSYISVL